MGEAARKGLQRGEHMFMLDLVMTAPLLSTFCMPGTLHTQPFNPHKKPVR